LSYRDPIVGQDRLDVSDCIVAVVKDRRRERRVCASMKRLRQVTRRRGSAAGDHRHVDRRADRRQQGEVVAFSGAIAIPAGQKDLTGAAHLRLLCPGDGIFARAIPSGSHHDLPSITRCCAGCIQRQHHTLSPKLVGQLGEQIRARDRRGVDADLVRSGGEQLSGVLDCADPTADGQRNVHHRANGPNGLDRCCSALRCRGNIEQNQLIGALLRVEFGALCRIARITQPLKLDAFYDSSIPNV